MRGEDQFAAACVRLRAAAPQAWDEFVMALRTLAAVKAAELVRAPPESIMGMQGQARAFEEISTMAQHAPETNRRIEEKNDERRRAAQAGAPVAGAVRHPQAGGPR